MSSLPSITGKAKAGRKGAASQPRARKTAANPEQAKRLHLSRLLADLRSNALELSANADRLLSRIS